MVFTVFHWIIVICIFLFLWNRKRFLQTISKLFKKLSKMIFKAFKKTFRFFGSVFKSVLQKLFWLIPRLLYWLGWLIIEFLKFIYNAIKALFTVLKS